MAEERIDIEVRDKVDSGIAKKLVQIADAAERGETYIERLQRALAAVNGSALDRLASAMAKADNAQAKLIGAQARLTNAQNQGAVAAQKVALAQQKLATESARTAEAQARVDAAQSRATAAATAAEGAALRLATAQQRAAATAAATASAAHGSAAAATQASAAFAKAGGSAAQMAGNLNSATGAMNNLTAATTRANGATNASVQAANQAQRAMRQTTAANANIIAQIQDIGVSLAGGQNPLLVLIQQGSQLSYIAATMQGGWAAMARTVGALTLRLLPLAAALGGLYLAFKQTQELAEGSGLDSYIKTLGLTDREVRRLTDTHVTAGDTIRGFWYAINSDILAAMGLTFEQISDFWKVASENIVYYMKMAAVGVYAATATLIQMLGRGFTNLGKIFYNAGVVAKNLFLVSIEALVNKTIDGINAIGSAINWLSNKAGFGDVVTQLGHISLGVSNVNQGLVAIEAIDPWAEFINNGRRADQYLSGLANRTAAYARQNAQNRLRNQANEIIADRVGGSGGGNDGVDLAERRAHALEGVNRQLDNEISRMRLLKGERDIQQRMDQIEEQLAQRRIQLTDTERAAIEAKVREIERFKYVQSEMDKIYEEATGAQRTYNATLKAAQLLLTRGQISQERYNQTVALAGRTLEQATDPLFGMKEALSQAEAASLLYGQAAEQANYIEQIRQTLAAVGIPLYDATTGAINREAAALIARNNALLQQQYIQQQVASIISPLTDDQRILDSRQAMYDEIERLRQADIISERQAAQARATVNARYDEVRLRNASQMFEGLASLARSSNKKLSAIGKAAAVAQATIDGYLAIQKALASAPPPINYAMAAGVAVQTAANIAGILNVGSFANGGDFMVGGKGGVDNNTIAMNVSRGERVRIDTPAQQRAGSGINIQIDNYSSATLSAERIDENTVRIIAREEAKSIVQAESPRAVGNAIGDPSSPVSKALSRHTRTERKR